MNPVQLAPIGSETRTLSTVRDQVLAVPNIILRLFPARGSSFDVPLGLRPLVLGRDASADIILEDNGISQRHCEISLTMRGVEVEDLQSKNGIFIHSVRILQAILPLDVPVNLGHSKFLVTSGGAVAEIPISASQRLGRSLGKSVVMRALFYQMEQAAKSPTHVVFWGERGTGKRTLAETLHEITPEQTGSFCAFDAGFEEAASIESAFQHSVEGLTNGTLYVHEPTSLGRELQLRLAGVITRLGNRVRLVLGMVEDPAAAVKRGVLAGELFTTRTPFVNLPVFPLRQRREDIPALVEFFLAKHGTTRRHDLTRETLDLLERHSWPGNVAQLEEMVADIAQKSHIGERLLKSLTRASDEASGQASSQSLKDAREEIVNAFEKAFVESALRKHKGNVTHTAKSLDISRQMLHRLMVEHGLQKLK
jgi:two-component system, NtrC family, response regulator GlrR